MGYNPDIWHNPFAKDVIVDWAKSFYPGDISDIELVFESLVVHGLLKEVHPETFDQPYFICSYDSEFLLELDNGEELVQIYREEYEFPQSSEYDSTWTTAGICKGQGSQSGNWPFYTCIGTSCFHFRDGSEECSHGLKFNPVLVKAYRERKQL